MFGSCSGMSKGQVWGNLIKVKQSIIQCPILCTCFAFHCLFLWFYVCFGVIGLFWKDMEERSLNRSKRGKIGIFFMKQADFGQTGQVDCFRQKLNSAVLVSGATTPAFRKPYHVSFFGSVEMGKLGRFVFRLSWQYKDDQNSPWV